MNISRKNKINLNSQHGSLLTEMMIGLAISAMTVLLVTFISFEFEKQKKITTSVSQTVSSNALLAFPLQTVGKNVGFGFNSKDFLGCTVRAANSANNSSYTFSLVPAAITTVDGLKDRITLIYGSSNSYYNKIQLTAPMTSNDGPIAVASRFGINLGDVLLLSEPGQDCSLVQVTGLPTDIGQTNLIKIDAYTYSVNGLNIPATYNMLGFNNHSYTTSAKVGNLGPTPGRVSFYINDNGQFVEEHLENSTTGNSNIQVIGDNVVAFKVQYALDTDGDKNVDTWTSTAPSMANSNQIIGFRYALISRDNSINPSYNGICNATVNSEFSWEGGDIDVADSSANWQCYRYRMVQGTVAFKNMLWAE